MKAFFEDFVLGLVGKCVIVYLAAAMLTLCGLLLAALAVMLHIKPLTLLSALLAVSVAWEVGEWVSLWVRRKARK